MKILFLMIFFTACASHHHEDASQHCQEYDDKLEHMREGNSWRR